MGLFRYVQLNNFAPYPELVGGGSVRDVEEESNQLGNQIDDAQSASMEFRMLG